MAGMYRIGPSDLFTPGDLLADANTLNGQMNALDSLDMTKVSQSFFDGWNAFIQEWRTFYSTNFGSWFSAAEASVNDSNRDQLIQFETRFSSWATQYQTESGGALPGGVVNVSTGAQDTLGAQIRNQLQPLIPSINMTYVLYGVVGVGAAVVLYIFRRPFMALVSKGVG